MLPGNMLRATVPLTVWVDAGSYMAPRNNLIAEGVRADDLAAEQVAHIASEPGGWRYGLIGAAGGAAGGIETLEREVEKGLVLAVVDLRDPDRAAE